MFTVGRLSGKHDAIGTVQDGIGHIGTFGTGGTGVVDHGFQHLCGCDDGLSGNVGPTNHEFLRQKDLFGRDFHTQVTTGNHDTIRDSQDFIIVFHSFLVFNLADNLDSLALFAENLANLEHVRSLAHKGGGNEINIVGDTPFGNVGNVLLGQGGKVDNDTGQVHVLTFANGSIVFDTAGHFTVAFVRGQHRQDQTSVGHQDLLSRSDTLGQGGVTASQLLAISLEGVVRGEGDGFSLDQSNLLSFGKESRSDFGSLGVQHDGNLLVLILGRLAKTVEAGLVTFVVPVRKVETSHGEASVDQFFQLRNFPASRTQGANNLGLSSARVGLGQDLVERNVSTAEFGPDGVELRGHFLEFGSHCVSEFGD
mmetsp:Transcript_28672/g.67156  ORF Transcript_28672/g.67156 Transcript_28672/m.67156 type:complete len:366 (-) Transcript_28672:68-1165(-)